MSLPEVIYFTLYLILSCDLLLIYLSLYIVEELRRLFAKDYLFLCIESVIEDHCSGNLNTTFSGWENFRWACANVLSVDMFWGRCYQNHEKMTDTAREYNPVCRPFSVRTVRAPDLHAYRRVLRWLFCAQCINAKDLRLLNKLKMRMYLQNVPFSNRVLSRRWIFVNVCIAELLLVKQKVRYSVLID